MSTKGLKLHLAATLLADYNDLAADLRQYADDADIADTRVNINGVDMDADEQRAYIGLRMAQSIVHRTSLDAGWYTDTATGQPIKRNFGEVVALMHSELSEALEADRKGLMDDKLPHRDGREVEFADCIIRILDTAADLGLDVAGALIEKNRFNRERDDHKIAHRNATGGKKY